MRRGSWARALVREAMHLHGIDSLSGPAARPTGGRCAGSGVDLLHADLRVASDFESLPAVDWVIDAAANPSVLAGVDGRTSSRQLVEHNLLGTINLLEYCRAHGAGLDPAEHEPGVLDSPSCRRIRVEEQDGAFRPVDQDIAGLSARGIDGEVFHDAAAVSLYGATKLASEQLALEYGAAFDFPVWINRCGVLAGGGQFGRADQGIFSFWIHSWASRRPLTYIGFGGTGHQVRDCLHPRDLLLLLTRQIDAGRRRWQAAGRERLRAESSRPAPSGNAASGAVHVSGRTSVAAVEEQRPFDVPWVVLDSAVAEREWGWSPTETPRGDLRRDRRPRRGRPGLAGHLGMRTDAGSRWLRRRSVAGP